MLERLGQQRSLKVLHVHVCGVFFSRVQSLGSGVGNRMAVHVTSFPPSQVLFDERL